MPLIGIGIFVIPADMMHSRIRTLPIHIKTVTITKPSTNCLPYSLKTGKEKNQQVYFYYTLRPQTNFQ